MQNSNEFNKRNGISGKPRTTPWTWIYKRYSIRFQELNNRQGHQRKAWYPNTAIHTRINRWAAAMTSNVLWIQKLSSHLCASTTEICHQIKGWAYQTTLAAPILKTLLKGDFMKIILMRWAIPMWEENWDRALLQGRTEKCSRWIGNAMILCGPIAMGSKSTSNLVRVKSFLRACRRPRAQASPKCVLVTNFRAHHAAAVSSCHLQNQEKVPSEDTIPSKETSSKTPTTASRIKHQATGSRWPISWSKLLKREIR